MKTFFSLSMSCTRTLSLSRPSLHSLPLSFVTAGRCEKHYEGEREGIRRLNDVSNGTTPAQCRRWWDLWILGVYTQCFPHREALFTLMRAFLMGGNCFFITGTFACHVAGVLSGYKDACLYICLTDTHLVRLLFKGPIHLHSTMQTFILNCNTRLHSKISSFTRLQGASSL